MVRYNIKRLKYVSKTKKRKKNTLRFCNRAKETPISFLELVTCTLTILIGYTTRLSSRSLKLVPSVQRQCAVGRTEVVGVSWGTKGVIIVLFFFLREYVRQRGKKKQGVNSREMKPLLGHASAGCRHAGTSSHPARPWDVRLADAWARASGALLGDARRCSKDRTRSQTKTLVSGAFFFF